MVDLRQNCVASSPTGTSEASCTPTQADPTVPTPMEVMAEATRRRGYSYFGSLPTISGRHTTLAVYRLTRLPSSMLRQTA